MRFPAPPTRVLRARAFTLIELMVVVAILAVVATMVLPMMRNDERLRLIATSSLLRSDIEFAQTISIAQPWKPCVVQFNTAAGSYFVAHISTPTIPIVRDDTGMPYAVTLGQGRAAAGAGVTMSASGLLANGLYFDTHGGLLDFSQTPVITLQAGNEWFRLTIEPTTGTITETSGTGAPP